MRQDVAKDWVNALRSDKYIQGRKALLKDNTYCCLGVLCDLSPIEKDKPQPHLDTTWDENPSTLPSSITKWAGMNSSSGLLSIKKTGSASLLEANDSGKSFNEIADIIEKHWEQL